MALPNSARSGFDQGDGFAHLLDTLSAHESILDTSRAPRLECSKNLVRVVAEEGRVIDV